MNNAFRPSSVSLNAAATASAAALAIPGAGTFVRVANLSQVTSVASDIQPMVYVLFGNDTQITDKDGAAVTLTVNNGLGLAPGQVAYLLRPSGATTLWHIASATGRIGVSTGEMA